MKKIFNKLKELPWLTYWLVHAIISLAITLSLIAYGNNKLIIVSTGVLFYLGREIAQYEGKKTFDYKGLLAPVIAAVILYHII